MRAHKYKRWYEKTKVMSLPFTLKDALQHEVDYLEGGIDLEFLGILDRWEEEICEGDILKDPDNEILIVEWHELSAGFRVKFIRNPDMMEWFSGELDSFDYEVIGNIYENPDLME